MGMDKFVVEGTPWEEYDIEGVIVHVKREDMSSPHPGPGFSKIRGVAHHIQGLKDQYGKKLLIGVLDTRHSKAGWGVAMICKKLGLKCVDFYPLLKGDEELKLRENQKMAQSFDAQLYPLKAGMSAVLFNIAKKTLPTLADSIGYAPVMMPNGLTLPESIEATTAEVFNATPKELLKGTWVVSISSGTIGSGVYKGLVIAGARAKLILHMGYSRAMDKMAEKMLNVGGAKTKVELQIIDEGYQYADSVPNDWVPFPCNPFYDAKAFTWLAHHVHELKEPVIFWNIGS